MLGGLHRPWELVWLFGRKSLFPLFLNTCEFLVEEEELGIKGSYICGSYKPGQELFLIITPFLLQKVGSFIYNF